MLRPRSIDHIRHKIKVWAEILDRKDVYAVSVVILVGISAFVLGRLSSIDDNRPPVIIEQFSIEPISRSVEPEEPKTASISTATPISSPVSQTASIVAGKGIYVGSRTSDKYHLPHCSGAQRISEANKIWFASKAEAEKAGYVPAGNCKGI